MAIAVETNTLSTKMTSSERHAARHVRQAERRVVRAERRTSMTSEATAESFRRTEAARREGQKRVINDTWTRELRSTREASLSFCNANNEPVKIGIDTSLLGTSVEASFFWTGILGREWFPKPAALTVTDTDLNGQTRQRRIMVKRNEVGSDIYPFPGEQTVINKDPNYGVVYQTTRR